MLLLEVEGNWGGVDPEQISSGRLNKGGIELVMVTVVI